MRYNRWDDFRIKTFRPSTLGRVCLNCNTQDLKGGARGLCKSCYLRAFRRVKQGQTTWEELIRANLALPNNSLGQPKRKRMRQAIIELDKEGKYPTNALINTKLKRMTSSLSGEESQMKHEIFKELGISQSE